MEKASSKSAGSVSNLKAIKHNLYDMAMMESRINKMNVTQEQLTTILLGECLTLYAAGLFVELNRGSFDVYVVDESDIVELREHYEDWSDHDIIFELAADENPGVKVETPFLFNSELAHKLWDIEAFEDGWRSLAYIDKYGDYHFG